MSAEWIIKYVCYNHISSGLQRLLDHHQSFHICGSTHIMTVNLALSSILNTDTDKLSVAYRKLVGIGIRVDARGQLLIGIPHSCLSILFCDWMSTSGMDARDHRPIDHHT